CENRSRRNPLAVRDKADDYRARNPQTTSHHGADMNDAMPSAPPPPTSVYQRIRPYLVLGLVSIILIAGEFFFDLLGSYWYTALAIAGAVAVYFVLAWVSQFKAFVPYLAPILISIILLAGELSYGILQSYWHTATAIVTAILLEIALSLFATGRFPHLASAYITGISVGILVRSLNPWLYALCSFLSISSKYALRVRNRHLWNPSNLGVSILLFLIPQSIAPLSLEWGNHIWVPMVILCLGFLILFTLGRLHITLTYVVAFSLLSMLRSALTERPIMAEIGLLPAPAYLLFMFFMITD